MNGQTRDERGYRFEVPWDITEWISREALLRSVVEDIDSLDWNNPPLLDFLRVNPAFQPRLLLILITYAYSMGICESEDVLNLYHRDESLKQLFPLPPVSARAITRFRRENRGLLRWSVNQMMKRALRSHFGWEETPIQAGLKRALLDAAGMRIDIGRHLDRSVEFE